MENDAKKLYEQVYLFFSKEGSKQLVMTYIKKGIELLFNYDTLVIITKYDKYTISVIDDNIKKYWNIYSSKKDTYKKITCYNGNLDDVFKYICDI